MELGPNTQTLPKTAKIPCIFPVNREIQAETGSLMTVRTTIFHNADYAVDRGQHVDLW